LKEKPQNICLLGSTGSIGKQVLNLVQRSKLESKQNRYKIISLACRGSDQELILEQIKNFQPERFFIYQKEVAEEIRQKLSFTDLRTKIYSQNSDYLIELCLDPKVETVIVSSAGTIALKACLASIKAKKKIIIANKETLISAGQLINETLESNPESILIPADSEHAGIHQCLNPSLNFSSNPSLNNKQLDSVRNLYLTASGGPFFKKKDLNFQEVKVEEALNHPTWQMGKKITIDSATMMNKGFEIIEAHYLFKVDYSKIKAVVHPQSLVHSLVEFKDGNILAQLAPNDMRLILQYCLDFPERKNNLSEQYLDLFEINKLEFYQPDYKRFKCLEIAYFAGKLKQSYPATLVIADQMAIDLFFMKKISFAQIPEVIDRILQDHSPCEIKEPEDLEQIKKKIESNFLNFETQVS